MSLYASWGPVASGVGGDSSFLLWLYGKIEIVVVTQCKRLLYPPLYFLIFFIYIIFIATALFYSLFIFEVSDRLFFLSVFTPLCPVVV